MISMCLIPLIGRLSDRVGPYRVYFTGVAIFGLISWPLFSWVTQHPDREHLLEAQIVANVLMAFMAAGIPGMIAGLFPTAVRSTGMALAYNIGVPLFGGFGPFVMVWLTNVTGSKLAPSYYLMAVSLLSIAALIAARRHYRLR